MHFGSAPPRSYPDGHPSAKPTVHSTPACRPTHGMDPPTSFGESSTTASQQTIPPTMILIIGGGIAGLTTALFLHRIGVQCRVFEAYARKAELGGGLQLAPNGVNVLAALGLGNAMIEAGTVCRTYRFCNHYGDVLAEIDLMGKERYGADSITCTRQSLHTVLANALEAAGVLVEYGHRLKDAVQTPSGVTVTFENGASATGSVLVGADGIHSRTRGILFPSALPPVYLGCMGFSGLLRLTSLSPEHLRRTRLAEGVMTLTHGPIGLWGMTETSKDAEGNRRMMCWSNSPQPHKKSERAGLSDEIPEQIRALLMPLHHDWWEPIPSMLTASTGPDAAGPPLCGSIWDLPVLERWYNGRIILIGDAAHATGPGGQGASTALEDAHFLARCLKDAGATTAGAPLSAPSLSAAFSAFQEHRKPRVDRINAESRRRLASKMGEVGAIGGWLRDRFMQVVVWWMRDSFGAQEFGYRIPGYDTLLL